MDIRFHQQTPAWGGTPTSPNIPDAPSGSAPGDIFLRLKVRDVRDAVAMAAVPPSHREFFVQLSKGRIVLVYLGPSLESRTDEDFCCRTSTNQWPEV